MGRKNYRWTHATAPGTQVGRMICTCCHQPITEGQFRYRETRDAYLPQHRSCSEEDPAWARMDKERARELARASAIASDIQALLQKHRLSAEQLSDIASDMAEREAWA